MHRREWLSSQAAGGYVSYDEKTNQFSLSEEQAFTLANKVVLHICRVHLSWH